MSWLVHYWLLLYGTALYVIKDCQGLFLKHTQSGMCITVSKELVYNHPNHALPYYVVMTNNCSDDKAQFRYLDSELLHNIEKEGTLVSSAAYIYSRRWAVFKGISTSAKNYQTNRKHRLKQTAAGYLRFFQSGVCAEPSTRYVLRKTYCDKPEQKFTFGSVTNYGTKMESVHCSPVQHMVVKSADYGDFNKNGVFNENKDIDTKCSALTNCQVKSLCDGKRSCELTMNNNLLPSPYCSDTSKEIYIKYTCVDSNNSTTITRAPNIRLSGWPNKGYIQIKDGLIWRYVEEENWDLNREKMLCQHLGFDVIDAPGVVTGLFVTGIQVATGDLICYNTQPNETSCCVHLQPSTTKKRVPKIPFVRCKICNNPILKNSNPIFSGSGSENYNTAKFYSYGWCASGSTPYAMLDLRKEYHITRVVTMGNKDQTNWSESYLLKFSHNEGFVEGSRAMQINGNRNGYEAYTTHIDIYNARYIKIISIGSHEFCLRIELCGEVQAPAPVYDVRIASYQYTARVTWKIRTAPQDSSYITNIIIYLNGAKYQNISRETRQIDIVGLRPYTLYNVEIQSQDGSFQKSIKTPQSLIKTSEAVPSSPPSNVAFPHRSKNQLTISWRAPPRSSRNGKLTGYQVCYSDKARSRNPRCFRINVQSSTAVINNLRPATNYFVTIAAATTAGYGPKSTEISEKTRGGGCSKVLTAPSGIILSPNYGPSKRYPANLACKWTIKSPVGKKINLYFKDFVVEKSTNCREDYLLLYDGKNDSSRLIGRYCGGRPAPFTSSSNYIYMEFHSDIVLGFRGFFATYNTSLPTTEVPVITKMTQNQTVSVGEKIKLNCEAKGLAPMKISFREKNKELNSSNCDENVGCQVQHTKMVVEDTVITCKVWNSAGVTTRYI